MANSARTGWVPSVWVNAHPRDRETFEEAVAGGGGVLSDAAAADAFVWAVDDPPAIRQHLSPRVKWVQLSSAGIEDWFKAGVIDNSRTWTAAKGVYAPPIAEYVLAMILAAARQLTSVIEDRSWQPRDVFALAEATVCVVGAGGIGQAIIKLLRPLGARSIAVTRTGTQVPAADESIGPAGLDELLGRVDYLVLAAPETPETVGMFSRTRLALLPPHAWIINVGRGSIIDTDALVAALDQQRLGGAALDVTDPEPLPDGHRLWQLSNAIISSHTACTPRLGRRQLSLRIETNIGRFARGEDLLGTVDVENGY